jgi:transcriptional regulator with XRE-family HTH domain
MAKKRVKTDAFGVVMREIRYEKKLSQEDVAVRIDVARNYISYLESGLRYPSIEMLIALAQALDVRPGDMLDRIAARMASGKASPLKKQAGPV